MSTDLPPGLYEAAVAVEQGRHTVRMAHLETMRSMLRLLDEHQPALKARGIDLRLLDITQHSYWDDAGRSALHIPAGQLHGGGWRLFAALIDQGFTEVDRVSRDPFTTVRLCRGELRLVLPLIDPGRWADISARAAAYRRSTP
jgi:hypothetical protein